MQLREATVMTNIVQDHRWRAIIDRDRQAEGRFVYAVKTTGVYCSPWCPSRLPRRENVLFFADATEAEQAGYRPCKRCRQGRPSLAAEHAAKIAAACRYIEGEESTPSLTQIAAKAGLSPSHFHRLFKTATGVTPKAYAAAWRQRRLQQKLPQALSVTDAILAAGYQSQGRFYAEADAALGMTPTAYRSGGKGISIMFAIGPCSLGEVLVAQSERGICAIMLGDDPQRLLDELQDSFPQAVLTGGDAQFEQRVALILGFVDRPEQGLDLPLDIRGTAFQQRVWQALREIPPGRTLSYTEVAQRIGTPAAVRAVAGACAANVLAVAIPCHRVVRSNGALSGYRWGIERKRRLLANEAREEREPESKD